MPRVPHEKRPVNFQVWLSDEEASALRRLSSRLALTMGEFVRHTIRMLDAHDVVLREEVVVVRRQTIEVDVTQSVLVAEPATLPAPAVVTPADAGARVLNGGGSHG